jgi:hypothetical protein
MTEPLRLLGAPGSPYTRKTLAVREPLEPPLILNEPRVAARSWTLVFYRRAGGLRKSLGP